MTYYPYVPIHDLILKNCVEKPNNIAMVYEDVDVTYSQFSEACHSFASKLSEKNLEPGSIILLILPNGPMFPVCFVAASVLKVVCSPISPDSTKEEISSFMKECEPKLIITNHCVTSLPETDVDVLRVPDFFDLSVDRSSELNLPSEYCIDDVVLNPFSSGTTGTPKCCELTHRNFLAATYSLKEAVFDKLLLTTDGRTLAFLPFYHASGFWALLFCLMNGCTTYIMDSFHPVKLLDMVDKFDIEIINIIPPVAKVLSSFSDLSRFSSLRTVLCGAGALSKEDCEHFLSRFPHVENFLQGYGMTELVVLSHISPIPNEALGSCGKLIPHYEAKIVLEEGKESKTGELWLKSDAIMKQYKNGDQLCDENGFLHTGDLATKDENDYFYIVGRVKNLIKVSGFQVSPEEIEQNILKNSDVVECVVVGIVNEVYGEVPKAFLVLRDGVNVADVTDSVIKSVRESFRVEKHLRGGVKVMKELPKTVSGKIKRSALASLI